MVLSGHLDPMYFLVRDTCVDKGKSCALALGGLVSSYFDVPKVNNTKGKLSKLNIIDYAFMEMLYYTPKHMFAFILQ